MVEHRDPSKEALEESRAKAPGRSKRSRCEAREEWIPRRSGTYAAGRHDERNDAGPTTWVPPVFSAPVSATRVDRDLD
jgi:hypothetical protein